MDDFTIYGHIFKEAKDNLEKVLQRCKDYNLSLNSKKFFIMMEEGVVLGHFISPKGIEVDPAKIEVISTLPVPVKLKDVRSFLGHAGYYRHFIKNCSQITTPLYNLLWKDVKFTWTFECRKAFLQLKEVLTIALVLRGPIWELPFHIHIDTLDYAIGVVLGQKMDLVEHEFYYINKNLQGAEFH